MASFLDRETQWHEGRSFPCSLPARRLGNAAVRGKLQDEARGSRPQGVDQRRARSDASSRCAPARRVQARADAHRSGRALALESRRRGRVHARAAPGRARPRAPDSRHPPRRRDHDRRGRCARRPVARGRLQARDDLQVGDRPRAWSWTSLARRSWAKTRAARRNAARDRTTVRLPREEREELEPPTASHVAAVYRPFPRCIDCRFSFSTGRARESKPSTRFSSATTTSPAAVCGSVRPRRRPAGPSGWSCTRISQKPFQRLSARARIATPTLACSRTPARTLCEPRSRRRAGRSGFRLVASRSPPPADLAPASARRPVGAHRRTGRTARPRGHREHLFACDARRGRARLRDPARSSQGSA